MKSVRIDWSLVRDYLRYAPEALKMDVAYASWSGEPSRYAPLKAALSFTTGLWSVVVCAVRGHALIDDSYGGPESGCMAGHCSRCGWSFHHTLY